MSVSETNIPPRPRVKFAYSFDKDQDVAITQTTVIKSEPCFQVITVEDRALKDFYRNETKQEEETPLIEQSISLESDSLEEEDPSKSTVDFRYTKRKLYIR